MINVIFIIPQPRTGPMAVLCRTSRGVLIDHLRYINDMYSQTSSHHHGNSTETSYKLKSDFFNIRTPFMMDSQFEKMKTQQAAGETNSCSNRKNKVHSMVINLLLFIIFYTVKPVFKGHSYERTLCDFFFSEQCQGTCVTNVHLAVISHIRMLSIKYLGIPWRYIIYLPVCFWVYLIQYVRSWCSELGLKTFNIAFLSKPMLKQSDFFFFFIYLYDHVLELYFFVFILTNCIYIYCRRESFQNCQVENKMHWTFI